MACLRTSLSPASRAVYKYSLGLSEEDLTKPHLVINALREYYGASIGVSGERQKFLRLMQNEDEQIGSWETRIRNQASQSEYESFADEFIRDQFIAGLTSETLHVKLIGKGHRHRDAAQTKVKLQEVVEIAKSFEATAFANQLMRTARSTQQEQVNFTNKSTRENQTFAPPTPLCYWCRGSHPSPRQHHCPAFGKRCNKCGIVGHFASACKGGTRKQASNRKQSNFVDDDADEEAFVAECKASQRPAKKFFAHLHLVHGGKSKIVRAQIDSASTCNTMPSTSVTPVHAPTRRVPVANLDRVKEELKRLSEEGIIRPVTLPTDWLSNMLVKEKPNGKLWICIDPSQTINKAIKRPKYTIPTIEEKLPLLTRAKVFTIVDGSGASHTIVLDEKSSLPTTFQGPNGRYCYNRMPFGIASGLEEYQRRQHEFLDGLRSVINIADDICVYGCGDSKEDADIDHDRNLVQLLEKCAEHDLRYSAKKLQFKSLSVTFMGHKLTHKGVEPNPAKVAAIREMPVPTDQVAVQRFLRMCQ